MSTPTKRVAYRFYRDIPKLDGNGLMTVLTAITAEENKDPDRVARTFVHGVLEKCGGENPKLFRAEGKELVPMEL